MAMNPLRLDPTRTTMERNQFIAAISQRMNALRKAIRQLIVVEDAFGLQADERVRKAAEALVGADATTHTIPLDVVFNTKFQFATDDAKVVAYQEWLKGEIEAGLLKVDPMHANEPWLAPYIQGAYKKGALRAYTDVHKVGGNTMPFVEGGKKAFLEMSFNTPLAQGKLKALSTRAFTQLKGVTAQMDADMTRILAQGLAQGKGAAFIAKELEKNVTGLDKKRARTIARTEIVHAHNEGTLDSFEAMNIHDVGVMAEWSTAHDGLVCPQCAPMEGLVLTIKEARGMLPRHPNCRCAWIPANVGEHKGGTTKRTWAGPEQGLEAPGTLPTGKTTGQTFSKPGIDFGIKESIKAEVPNTPIKVARQKSKWVGADKTITGKVNPGSKKALADKAAKKAETSAALKAAKQQAAEKEAADQAAKKAARAAKKAEKEAEEIALKKAAKDAEIQAVKDKYGLSDKAIEPDGMGDMVLSDDGVAEYLSKFGETELTPQQYKKVFITPPEPGQSPVIAQMDTLAKIVDENVAAKAAAKEAAIEKTAKLKKKFNIGEDGTSDGPDGVPWLNEKGIDDFGSLHGVKYTNMEKDQIIFFTTPKEGQSYLEAQVLKMDSIASEKIKAAQEAAESILTKTDDAKTAFKKWGKETPGDPAALDLADYSGVDGWTPGNKKQSYGFVIFDDQGRVLMREPTGHFGGAHWTFAKGGGTKPATTALAELGEETGHKGLIHDIIPGGFTGTTSKTNYFVGKSGGFDASLMDTETAAVKWMDFDEALKSIALSPDPTVVARDTAVLNAAFDVLKNSDGSLFKSLVKDGTEKLNATKNAAVAAAKSHKIKLGAAQTHYAKPKFGGGVTDADWVNPGTKNKLNMSGLDKVLSEKGWHTSTLPIDTVDALQGADDLVSQKAILDGLKKAPKGTVIPGKAPEVDAVDWDNISDDEALALFFPKDADTGATILVTPSNVPGMVASFDFLDQYHPKLPEIKKALSMGLGGMDEADNIYDDFLIWGGWENFDDLPKDEIVNVINQYKMYKEATKTAASAPVGKSIDPDKFTSWFTAQFGEDLSDSELKASIKSVLGHKDYDAQVKALEHWMVGIQDLGPDDLETFTVSAAKPAPTVKPAAKPVVKWSNEDDFYSSGNIKWEPVKSKLMGAGFTEQEAVDLVNEAMHLADSKAKNTPKILKALVDKKLETKTVPVPSPVDAALMDGAMVNNPTLIKEIFTKWIDGTGDLTRKEAMTAVGLFKKKHPHLYDMDAITVPLPTPAPAPAPTSFLLPMERDLVKVKDLNGSTRPILAKDTTTGKQWVVKDVSKTNITPDHLRSEMLTDELYRVMNHAVPRGGLLETPSGPMKVTEFLDGGQTLAEWKVGKGSAEIKEMYEQLQKGFVSDALLANHDVVGQNFDNIFVVGGKAYRIDNGGGLTFRAQGLAKGTWGPKVQELAGMRDKKLNANTAEVFKGITDAEIHRQIRQIQANRANILAAIPDDSLRTTMAARIDDLVAQLPAQEVRQGVPTGVMRAEYGVTPNTVPRVEKARSNGVNLAVDRDHIEDNNALLWEEFDDKGNPVTVLQFKATKAGSDAIRVKMADELAAATKAAPSTPTTQSFKHPEDTYWDTVLAGYKTVNAHVPIPGSRYNDGKYNPGTLGKLYTVQDEIKAKLKTAKGDTKRMLEHYAKAIEDIDKAKESTAFPDPVFSYVWDPKKKDVIPRNPTRRAMRATRQNQTDLRLVTYKNGVGTRTAGANVVDTRELYTIDAGEDIEVKYFPRYDTWDREAGLALQGTVTVRVPGTGDTAIAKALQTVDALGVDNNAPTLAYEESLYLHRGINQKRVGNSEYDKIWKDTTLTDEERVIKQKAWIKDNLKIDVDTRPGYDPHGVTKHADGTGFRHWERWDLSKEEIAEAMPDYSLLHTTASLSDSPKGAVGRLLDGILNSGGEFTSTGGRLRKGVALRQTGGASAEEDLNTGGASSFFTRIKKVSATNRGVYFRIGALSRQDTVSYPGDRYGRISALSERTSTIEGYKRYAEGGSNETLFKEGLGLNDIDYIRITDEEERKEVIAIFHKHGIKSLPDGRSVEDVVVTQRQKPKKRRLS